MQLGFIPKMWQPSFPDVPQIPYTFAPRQAHAAPGKRRGRKGSAGNPGTAAGAAPPIYALKSMSLHVNSRLPMCPDFSSGQVSPGTCAF